MVNLNDLQNAICDMVDIQKGVPERIQNYPKDNEATDLDAIKNIFSEGLTNDQALAYVETKFGSMGKDHCKELLKQFNEPDFGTPTPDDWR